MLLSFPSQQPGRTEASIRFTLYVEMNEDEQKKREREGERICFSSFYFPSPGCCRSVLGARTIDFDNVFGYVDELVDEPLAVHFSQNATLVVIPQCSTHRFVVHVGFVLMETP